MTEVRVEKSTTIHDIDAAAWDALSAGMPFQSHQWYVYCERVMADCSPIYLLVYRGNHLLARASFWLVSNEPIPPAAGPFREVIKKLIRVRPLLICRSPFANASGLILPDDETREWVIPIITNAILQEAAAGRASLVVLDGLRQADTMNWPAPFRPVEFPNGGTILHNRWSSLEAYLAEKRNKKNRRHYQHTIKEVEAQGVELRKYKNVPDLNAALGIIENLEKQHDSSPNPWKRAMLENMALVNGTWLDARINDRLVGGMLLLNDNGAQTATLPGLAADVSHVYFLMLYAGLETAFEEKMRLLRWGSGAYEAKRRLGFEPEANQYVLVCGAGWLTRKLLPVFMKS